MKGNIVQFVEDIRRGDVDNQSFLDGLCRFLSLLTASAEDDQARAALQIEDQNGNYDIQSVAHNFTLLLSQLHMGKRHTNFLEIEFHYLETSSNSAELPDSCLCRGLDGLVQTYTGTPSTDRLQCWSNILCAANFSTRSHQTHELSPTDVIRTGSTEDKSSEMPQPVFPDSTQLDTQCPARSTYVSIGLVLDEVYGTQEDLREDVSLPGYKRAVANWNRLLAALLSKSEERADFTTKLSACQLNSLRLLIEWWDGSIDSKASSSAAFHVLEGASNTGLVPNIIIPDVVPALSNPLNSNQQEYDKHYIAQQILFGPCGPPYRWALFRLFQVEFLPVYYDSRRSDTPHILNGTRKLATKMASSQRTAIICYKSLLATCGLDSIYEEHQNQLFAEFNDQSPNEGCDTLLDETSASYASTSGSLKSERSSSVISAARGSVLKRTHISERDYDHLQTVLNIGKKSKISASISVCDWLGFDDVEKYRPYYLWDRIQQKSVKTEDLNDTLEYTAVSHTWGRWRKKGIHNPSVAVKGVVDWLVPQNSKFNIQDLPNILNSVPCKTRYIWFDLVCIPQEPIDAELDRIGKLEISRQAAIFRSARYAVAWINEIEDWKGIQAAIRRLSVNFLQEPLGHGHNIPAKIIDLIENDSKLNLEFFDTSNVPEEAPESAMNGWFSSLWTLQELCLRPDMLLCNRSWEILALAEEDNAAVSIEDLIALSEGGRFAQDTPWSTVPDEVSAYSTNYLSPRSTATDQLADLLALTGLEHLLNISRTTILTLGNQRYCEENRAEAIMSAVNIRNWYTRDYNNGSGEPDSRPPAGSGYPQEFLQEAATKIGADFYASTLGEGELLENLLPHLTGSGARGGVGSMMPFTSSKLSSDPGFSEGYVGEDHAAVATWDVQPDYSVKILKAGIVSYTNQVRVGKRNIICTILGPDSAEVPSLLVKEHKGRDLDAWVDSFLPTTRNFAVCLHNGHAGGMSDGILLKEVSSGQLIKIGTYCITLQKVSKRVNPGISEVNWTVL